MPAIHTYSEMNPSAASYYEDACQRALHLAQKLSLIEIGADDELNVSQGTPSISQSALEAEARKKSANMTECVPVPSSEHVAEIVGRQG